MCVSGNLTNAAAMENAIKKCYGRKEQPMKNMIQAGAQGSQMPWVTLYSASSFSGEHLFTLKASRERDIIGERTTSEIYLSFDVQISR